MTKTHPQDAALLADILLPGRAPDWPAASAVLDPQTLAAALGGLADLCAAVAGDDPDRRVARIRAHQAEHPAEFEAGLGALTDAYYGTATVQARCRVLAEAGPWPEDGQFFDPSRLATVRAR